MKRVAFVGRLLLLVVLLAFTIIGIFYLFAPVYDFKTPQQFSGDLIYNPYQNIDSTTWKKANFHCHTTASDGHDKLEVVQKAYRSYGYDILAVSDHNLITNQGLPVQEEIPTYEHGINISKYHSVVMGAKRSSIFDFVLLSTESNRFYTLKWLRTQGDIVVFDHPDRTRWLEPEDVKNLTYYDMMEVERGFTDGVLSYYDEALSHGHYSFVLASDDCHEVGDPKRFARAATFVSTPTKRYKDIKNALLSGHNFALTIPAFNDSSYRIWRHFHLPKIRSLTLNNDTVNLTLTEPATIKVFGHSGIMQNEYIATTEAKVPFLKTDTYLRFAAIFSDSVTLYTNPIARYKGGAFPIFQDTSSVNYPLTVLYILGVSLIVLFSLFLFFLVLVRTLPARFYQKVKRNSVPRQYASSEN